MKLLFNVNNHKLNKYFFKLNILMLIVAMVEALHPVVCIYYL